ncbi:MAG: hypothetical protein M0R74_09705 [Dehalococcoidia bacterium]|jgi:hypothetical protein|nr:hypothetical protein [Dehalococcoidia bacterium]
MKILGYDYKIEFDNLWDKKQGASGSCCANILTITLDPTFPAPRMEESLLHEIFEAIKFHLNYGERFPHEMLSQLSEVLYQVMKDNPEYFSFRVPGESETSKE